MKTAVALALLIFAAPAWLESILSWPPTPPDGAYLIVEEVGGDVAVAVAYSGVHEPPLLEASTLGINVDAVAVAGCDSLSWGVESLPTEAVAVVLGEEEPGLCRINVTISPAATPAAPGALYVEWPGGLLAISILAEPAQGYQGGGASRGHGGSIGGLADYHGLVASGDTASRDNPWIPMIVLVASLAVAVVAELGVQRRP